MISIGGSREGRAGDQPYLLQAPGPPGLGHGLELPVAPQ